MADKKKNVFISHAHQDDDDVKSLKDLLKKNGYEFRDSSITSDKPNRAKNEQYIKNDILAPRIQWAGVVIVLISKETRHREWVDWEIEHAIENGKRVIGVWEHGAADEDLPDPLEKLGDAVVVGWNAEKIIDAIEGKDDWQSADGEDRPPRNIKRYSCA